MYIKTVFHSCLALCLTTTISLTGIHYQQCSDERTSLNNPFVSTIAIKIDELIQSMHGCFYDQDPDPVYYDLANQAQEAFHSAHKITVKVMPPCMCFFLKQQSQHVNNACFMGYTIFVSPELDSCSYGVKRFAIFYATASILRHIQTCASLRSVTLGALAIPFLGYLSGKIPYIKNYNNLRWFASICGGFYLGHRIINRTKYHDSNRAIELAADKCCCYRCLYEARDYYTSTDQHKQSKLYWPLCLHLEENNCLCTYHREKAGISAV